MIRSSVFTLGLDMRPRTGKCPALLVNGSMSSWLGPLDLTQGHLPVRLCPQLLLPHTGAEVKDQGLMIQEGPPLIRSIPQLLSHPSEVEGLLHHLHLELKGAVEVTQANLDRGRTKS